MRYAITILTLLLSTQAMAFSRPPPFDPPIGCPEGSIRAGDVCVEIPTTDPTPRPSRGTVLGPEYCGQPDAETKWRRGDRTTLYTRVANGTGGTYRKVVELRSEQCIIVDVELVKESGDRFDPVRFEIDAPEGYSFDLTNRTIGNATMLDDALLIHGDGRLGTGYVTIDDEEYSYEIVAEPRCGTQTTFNGSFVDCQGLNYRGRSDGLIYYGEEDTRVVTWEIAIHYYTSNPLLTGIVDRQSPYWERSEKKIELYNQVYERSNVHIRYKLVEVGRSTFDVRSISLVGSGEADIILGAGSSCPATCGCASVNTYFRENSGRGLGSTSFCGGVVDLHEIGHSVGLAHGPDNRLNQAEGYIFRDFGHGHSTPFCGYYTDVMSYASTNVVHNNSTQTCGDYALDPSLSSYIDPSDYDRPAGNRDFADSAYHLNRVRYDVSLISCKRDNQCVNAPELSPMSESEDDMIIVEDYVDEFENGPEMVERARREQEQFLRNNPQFRRQ